MPQNPSSQEIIHLLELLKEPDSTTRTNAVQQLGQLGDKRAVEALIEVLSQPGITNKMAAAQALGRIGDERAIAPLVEALRYYYPEVTNVVSEVLVGFGNAAILRLVVALQDSTYTLPHNAGLTLAKLGKPAMEQILELLKSDLKIDYIPDSTLVASLALFGEEAAQPLIQILFNENVNYSWEISEALVKIGEPALNALLEVINSPEAEKRLIAARALTHFSHAYRQQALSELLKLSEELNADSRVAVAITLQDFKGEAVEQALLKLLQDENVRVKFSAAHSLGFAGTENVLYPLKKLVNDLTFDPIFGQTLGEIVQEAIYRIKNGHNY